MNDIGSLLLQILELALIVGVAGASIVYARSLDRDRIRQYVEKAGGKIVEIDRMPFGPGWFGSRERIYEVKYQTRHGKVLMGTCKTSMFAGVYWAGHAPGLKDTDESPGAPPEPITCLACGARIPARQTHCPKCGWSYKAG